MRHVFLINPHAGKQDQTARIRALADRLAAAHNLDCRCLLTDRPGGAEVLSRALAEAGEPVRIYACGGDGTALLTPSTGTEMCRASPAGGVTCCPWR